MRVLLVSTSDIDGGAARAAYRLHRELLSHDINSQMLVQRKSSDDFTVLSKNSKFQRALSFIRPTLDILPTKLYKKRTKTLFSPAWLPFSGIVKTINELNPDLVHLHWVCGGMIKIEEFAKIKAPIIWTLHDNWAFTGGCHIMWDCEKYKDSCGTCPRLGSQKNSDLSSRVFYKKKKIFNKKDMTIVCLSKWLHDCSKSSTLLGNKKHVQIPNLINTDQFKPCDREKSRELWNLPQNKKLILFGAMSATSDVNKGFLELTKAFSHIKREDVELVVFGSGEPKDSQEFGFKTHYLGYLHDDISLVTLYSAVDVMIVSSLQENLSNAIMESLSCGTPVVGFDTGGNSDMVEHKVNGYLANSFESQDLANGIEWILNNSNYDELCQNSREKVLQKFDAKVVVKKYIKLYNEILDDK